MSQLEKLNSKNLFQLPGEIEVPDYNRVNLKTGIVHIGVGFLRTGKKIQNALNDQDDFCQWIIEEDTGEIIQQKTFPYIKCSANL